MILFGSHTANPLTVHYLIVTFLLFRREETCRLDATDTQSTASHCFLTLKTTRDFLSLYILVAQNIFINNGLSEGEINIDAQRFSLSELMSSFLVP